MGNQSDSSKSIFDAIDGTSYNSSAFNDDTVLIPIVDKLMQEVGVIFDRTWTADLRACGESGHSSSSSSSSRMKPSSSGRAAIHKRQREDGDDGYTSGDDNGKAPKRSNPVQTPPDGMAEQPALSCPFRKHNSGKYRFPEFKTCALSSWESVGRVK